MKKLLAITVGLSLLSMPVQALDLGSFGKNVPGLGQVKNLIPKKQAKDGQAINCRPSGADASLDPKQMILARGVKVLVNEAMSKLLLDGVELPEKIADTCQADKRLSYIEDSTGRWSQQVVESIQQAAEALEIDAEIESYRVFSEGNSLQEMKKSQVVSLGKSIKSDMNKIESAMENKAVEDKEMKKLLAKASANMRAAALNGLQIAAWDKRMGEFMTDNIAWAVNNHKRAKVFGSHAKLLGSTLTGMQKVNEAYQAGHSDSVSKKTYKRTLAKREKANAKEASTLAKNLEL